MNRAPGAGAFAVDRAAAARTSEGSASSSAIRIVCAAVLLAAWQLPRLQDVGFSVRAQIVALFPLGLVVAGALASKSTPWKLPSRTALVLFGLGGVFIEIALFRSVGEFGTLRAALSQTVQFCAIAAVGGLLFWVDGDENRDRSAQLLMLIAGGYVCVNLVLYYAGVTSPLEKGTEGTARLASILGVERARMYFPLGDGANDFGNIAGAALLAGLMLAFARIALMWRALGLVAAAAGVIAIFGTDTRAAFISAIGVAALITVVPRRRLVLATIVASLLTIAIPIVAGLSSSGFDVGDQLQIISRGVEDFSTMNGRVTIWGAGVNLALSGQPGLFGYGAYGHDVSGVSEEYRSLFDIEIDQTVTLHNTALQYVVDSGYVGLLVVVALVLVALRTQLRLVSSNQRASRVPIALLIYFLLSSMTEALGTIYHPESMAVVMLVIMASLSRVDVAAPPVKSPLTPMVRRTRLRPAPSTAQQLAFTEASEH